MQLSLTVLGSFAGVDQCFRGDEVHGEIRYDTKYINSAYLGSAGTYVGPSVCYLQPQDRLRKSVLGLRGAVPDGS